MNADEDRTLASVRAFVDAFEDDLGASEDDETAVKVSGVASGALSVFRGLKTAKKLSYKEPKYSTLLQRQKRAEIADLRELAREMEARISKLRQKTVEGLSPSESAGKRKWAVFEEQAAEERRERRRVERTNRKLREALERQACLREEISELIEKYQQKEGTVEDGESLLAAARSAAVSTMTNGLPLMFSCSLAVIPQVLDELTEQADAMSDRSFAHSQKCWLEISASGMTTEIQTSTTAECSVAQASDVLWVRSKTEDICSSIAKDLFYTKDDSHSLLRSLLPIKCRPWKEEPSSSLRDHTQSNGSSQEVVLLVEHYSRRIYDPITGRVIQVTLAHIRLSGDDEKLLLRERFLKCISPVNKPGGGGSITQTSYRIEPGDVNANKFLPMQASVMRALASLTRKTQAIHQEWLLDE